MASVADHKYDINKNLELASLASQFVLKKSSENSDVKLSNGYRPVEKISDGAIDYRKKYNQSDNGEGDRKHGDDSIKSNSERSVSPSPADGPVPMFTLDKIMFVYLNYKLYPLWIFNSACML